MCNTTKKDKIEVQKALDIMCEGIVSSKPTYKIKKGNYISRKELKAVHFLFDTNRIPYVCKKTLDKAKDLAFHGGNLNRITICILNGKMYIGDGQHRYLLNNALGLRTLSEFIYVNDMKQIFEIMKSQNTNQNSWDNKQALKFFGGDGGTAKQKANYTRLKLLKSRYYDVNFSNLWEIQAFLQYPDKIRTLEDIRSYSQKVAKGFKDGHYKISNEIEKECSKFLDKFTTQKVSPTLWRNAKVLRCILQLLVINKNKMTITRLVKQLSKHKINICQEEAFIKTDIKSIYERNSKVKLLTVA